jgi:hypothetical protein
VYEAGKEHDETSDEFDTGFLGNLALEWEKEALRATAAKVRVAVFRFGVILGKGGGALAKMIPLFKLGLGGVIGTGAQGFSWIHIEDLFRAYVWVLEDASREGVYNLTAPHPVTNKEMTKALGVALNRPAFLPVPTFALKLKFGEGAVILLEGQKVYPKHLLDEGFSFFYPQINQAFEAVVS